MATAQSDLQLRGLTKCLIQEGLLSEADAHTHIEAAQKKKIPLLSYLVANELVDSRTVASFASMEFGIPFFDLSRMKISFPDHQDWGSRFPSAETGLPLHISIWLPLVQDSTILCGISGSSRSRRRWPKACTF